MLAASQRKSAARELSGSPLMFDKDRDFSRDGGPHRGWGPGLESGGHHRVGDHLDHRRGDVELLEGLRAHTGDGGFHRLDEYVPKKMCIRFENEWCLPKKNKEKRYGKKIRYVLMSSH